MSTLVSSSIRNRSNSTKKPLKSLSVSSHDFHTKTFSGPSFCDLCEQFIWGLVKQGASCRSCGFNVHHKCRTLVPSSSVCGYSYNNSGNNIQTSASLPSPTIDERSDLLTKMFAETHSQSQKQANLYNETNPTLSIALFMKQNQRYTARQVPFIVFNETIIKLLCWDSVANTLCFLLCYALVCLNPILFAILPHITIMYIATHCYHTRASLIMTNSPLPRPHTFGNPPKMATLTFAENKAALQSIQNTMGQVADMYDMCYNIFKLFDWSNPNTTKSALLYTVASAVGTVIIMKLIPVNIVLLVGGIGAFMANSAIGRAIRLTVGPVVVEKVREKVIKNGWRREDGIDVELFENQRWWAGVGWKGALLTSERAPWSDESGVVALASKEEYPLPLSEDFDDDTERHYAWAGDWKVDMEWNGGGVDQEGWEFCNNHWGNPKKSRVIGCFTRRRRWTRMIKEQMEVEDQSTLDDEGK